MEACRIGCGQAFATTVISPPGGAATADQRTGADYRCDVDRAVR